MATPAEKKALIFVSVVALLGAGVRVWRLQQPATSSGHLHTRSSPDQYDHDPDDGNPTPPQRTAKGGKKGRKNARSKAQERRDSTSVVDLDRTSLHDLDALGVLNPGIARLIIADRDSFGPFGSLHELERVPYLTRADLRSLAPRVTFSLLPRPKNTVMSRRTEPETGHRTRRTTHRVVQ